MIKTVHTSSWTSVQFRKKIFSVKKVKVFTSSKSVELNLRIYTHTKQTGEVQLKTEIMQHDNYLYDLHSLLEKVHYKAVLILELFLMSKVHGFG